MPWPVLTILGDMTATLLSDRISDLISARKTKKRGKAMSIKTKTKIPLYSLTFPLKGWARWWAWISVSRPLEPALGRKFPLGFESAIQITKFLQPKGKPSEKRKL